MNLIEMSLAGGWMIAVVFIVRLLAFHRLPKKVFYVLWQIVLIRLLLPFSVPIPEHLSPIFPQMEVSPKAAAFPVPVLFPSSAANSQSYGTPLSPAGPSFSPWRVLWLIGFLAVALYFILSYFHIRQKFADSLPVENRFAVEWLRSQKLVRRAEIRQCSRIPAPLTYGILHPVILMPKRADWSDAHGLQYVLQHEMVHIRRFDALLKFLFLCALSIHWFHPLVWAMWVFANRDLELSCDEAVVRSLGESSKASYALALIRMEEQKSGLAAFYNGFSKNATEERIRAIMKFRKPTRAAVLSAAVIIGGLSMGFLTSAQAAAQLTPSEPVVPMGSKIQSSPAARAVLPETPPSILYENVELRYYDNGWPYLHDILTNNTGKTIQKIQYLMLAYDASGNPLEIYWNPLDSSAGKSYENLVEEEEVILPGETKDVHGGWSLYDGEAMTGWRNIGDGGPNKVAYALYAIKQAAFDDGTAWENPAIAQWLETYKGKSVDLDLLKNYYPYAHQIS